MEELLGWYDDSPKKPTAQKIREGAEAYAIRFNRPATLVKVNVQDVCDAPGLTIIVNSFVQKNNFWIGRDE